jgi:hypothetical protein
VSPGGEALLNQLERATARLFDLNPGDFAVVRQALEERARAIESLAAWMAAAQAPLDPDRGMAARIEETLAAGAHLAIRLTLVRAGLSTQIAELAWGRRWLDALAKAGAPITSSGLDCNG